MKFEVIISRIVSAIKGDKVAVRENLFYDTVKGTLDFADDDIPNWRATKAAIGAKAVRKSFTGTDTASGQLVINWNTDIAPLTGITYNAYFGNNVEPQWNQLPSGAGTAICNGANGCSYTVDGSGNVLIFTIDLPPGTAGYVRFG